MRAATTAAQRSAAAASGRVQQPSSGTSSLLITPEAISKRGTGGPGVSQNSQGRHPQRGLFLAAEMSDQDLRRSSVRSLPGSEGASPGAAAGVELGRAGEGVSGTSPQAGHQAGPPAAGRGSEGGVGPSQPTGLRKDGSGVSDDWSLPPVPAGSRKSAPLVMPCWILQPCSIQSCCNIKPLFLS